MDVFIDISILLTLKHLLCPKFQMCEDIININEQLIDNNLVQTISDKILIYMYVYMFLCNCFLVQILQFFEYYLYDCNFQFLYFY